MAQRYMGMIAGAGPDPHEDNDRLAHHNLMWMCDQIEQNACQWPDDKTGRWLGFIQGILASQGIIDVDVERDVSRPLFHQFYESNDVAVPESTERQLTTSL